jgi:hypothetical protein
MSKRAEIAIPPAHDWRTTDEDEVNRRRARAQAEEFRVTNKEPRHPVFSTFAVKSGSGWTYSVEIRDVRQRQFACECVDFRINGLGTCKHVEAVLLHLGARFKRLFKAAEQDGSPRLDVVPDANGDSLFLESHGAKMPAALRRWFESSGALRQNGGNPEAALEELRDLGVRSASALRFSQELEPWLERRRREAERKQLRRDYELRVQSGEWPAHETRVPLFPYQREGMLHLAFTERALLADEMGLGKTIQAIAACALLHRLGKAARVLVVTPASLKTEWEEQIQQFTELSYQLVFGGRRQRLRAYDIAGGRLKVEGNAPFFTIVNYEQMLPDVPDVNARMKPDVVILDEAQRIKNWNTKTSQAIKRLSSRYAFVLTGTPVENRLDEIYSLMGFLDPSLFGPLFRFNREYYELDERGRPKGFRNLEKLHGRIKPYMLRRRKADVETELPARSTREHFVPLSAAQKAVYDDHELVVSRLAALARRRPLTQQEQERLMRHLAMMRMVCDTNFILDPDDRTCPKLVELERILEECRENVGVKVIVFSEWERMLQLVAELCQRLDLGFAWHTGSVPQKRRRAEINLFKSDPKCRLFLSTDSGAAGLNLQNASVVINCDLPWNPAKLEQRIARAWRKNQTRAVTVVNLVSENTIEHRMLDTLERKRSLADGILELKGDLAAIKFQGGRQAFLARLQQLVSQPPAPGAAVVPPPMLPVDRPRAFAEAAQRQINGALVRCEERYPGEGPHSVIYVVVDKEAASHQIRLASLHEELFGKGRWDPLSPVRLEVVDRATDEALQRLIEAGLFARATRAIRPLWPSEVVAGSPVQLTPAELEKAAAHRQQAARKIKMARLLGGGELEDEAKAALRDAMQPLGIVLAIENRLPEPTAFEQLLLPPLAAYWKDSLPMLRDFAGGAATPWKTVAECLEKV